MRMSSNTDTHAILELRNVAKSFGAVVAPASADLRVEMHSIHAFVAENGTGKSARVKIIAGLYQSDSGRFTVDEEPELAKPLSSGPDRVRHQQCR